MYKHSNEYCKIICNDIIVCWLKPQKFSKAELVWFFNFTEEGEFIYKCRLRGLI